MSGVELTEFLLARIADDEAVAMAAAPGPWEYQDVESVGGGRICDPTVAIADLFYEQPGEVDPRIRRTVLSDEADGTGEHIARHDPARVLAECAAKRALVVMCQPDPLEAQLRALATTNPAAWNLVGPLVEQADIDRSVALRLLAFPYADHEDFREEWRP